jgi:hypothetical protein
LREPEFGSLREPEFGSFGEPQFGSFEEPEFGSLGEPEFGSLGEQREFNFTCATFYVEQRPVLCRLVFPVTFPLSVNQISLAQWNQSHVLPAPLSLGVLSHLRVNSTTRFVSESNFTCPLVSEKIFI